jgi:hypothetical protein
MYFVIHGGRKERRALIFSGVRGILLWAGDVETSILGETDFSGEG